MRIGFAVHRPGNLKTLGGVIGSSLERGHEVVIFMDPGLNMNPGEDIDTQALPIIWPTDRNRTMDVDARAYEIYKAGCDAIEASIGHPSDAR